MLNISFLPEHILTLNGFSITNTLLVSWLVVIFLSVIAFLNSHKLKLVPNPKSLQNLTEAAIEALFNLIQGIIEDKILTKKIFPLTATIFFFVLFSNWFELIPGVGTIGFVELSEKGEILVPFLRSPSSDLNMTLSLAVVSVIATQFFGISALGFLKYGKKFINLKTPITFFVGILELISEITRLISFSFRLFGNLFAGEVLLMVMLFLVPFIVPFPFFILELVVGFIQAFIFSILTVVFIKIATTPIGH